MTKLTEAVQLIREHHAFTIIGHINPDGDTLGSTLALGLGLEQLGKDVRMLNSDEVPEIYRFMAGSEKLALPQASDFQHRVVIFVDCTDLRRSGDEISGWLSEALNVLNFDHHISNEQFAQLNIVDPQAASTGIVILHVLKQLGVNLSSEIATCLFVTLITDTGSFRYTNTNPEAHLVAAELLQAGVNQEQVNRELYEEVPLATLQLIQTGIANLQLSECGKVAWIAFTQQTMDNLQAKDEHLEGLVNYAKSVKGVEVGLLFRETNPALTKVSLRSKSQVNVSDLAAQFGGGGHLRAAGCRCRTTLPEAIELVVKAAIEAVRTAK